jgi:hypothetical protein
MAAKRTSGNNPPEGSFKGQGSVVSCQKEFFLLTSAMVAKAVSRKGHEIVAMLFSSNILAHVNRQNSTILFFVRVNQVLVRLWARAVEAGYCLVFVPLLRLMSDRESVSVVSTPRFGF